MNSQLIADLFKPGLVHLLLDSEPSGTIQTDLNGFTATNLTGKALVFKTQEQAVNWLKTGKEPKPEKAQIKSNQLSLF